MEEHRVINPLATRLLLAHISQLVTRHLLREEPRPQHTVQHLGTRLQLQPIQATRQTTVQLVATSRHLPPSIRAMDSNHRVAATPSPVEDQATNSLHKDTNRVEGISLVVREVMAVTRAAEVDTKVVGIKAIVGVVAVVVAGMDSTALPMGKEMVAMEVAEEGRF